ncbi:MAG: tetratricopeptide repeat protein [Candidatus Acidiferrales bacterium]
MASVLLILALSAAPAVRAQTETKPLTDIEFVNMVNAKVPAADIIAQIHARGINFEVSAQMEADLQQVEGGPALLAAMKEPATLEVKVNVAGAEVAVDGEPRGTTPADAPLVVAGLKPGKHLVRAQADRHVGERTEVFLKPGETRAVAVSLLAAVEANPGLLGTEVNVRAGTKEDALVSRLDSISDPGARARQVQDMIREYGESPLALMGYGMLQTAYIEQNNFDDALAAGQEVLRRDPDNFRAQLRNTRALLGKGELDAAFESLGAARRLLEQGRERAADLSSRSTIEQNQAKQALEGGERALASLSYDFYAASAQLADPARKVAMLERFLEQFPSGDYTQQVLINLAYAYQQTGDAARSLATANRALEANPREASMMVLVADSLSDRGQELGRARQLATDLLDVLEDPAAMPGGMAEEQWAGLRPLWQGTAHSILGQVLMHEETAQKPAGMSKTRQAVEEFLAAKPLLKEQAQIYARNLFRLGFAYAKLGELVPARDALNEVIALGTPYTPHAQDLLGKVGAAMQRRQP